MKYGNSWTRSRDQVCGSSAASRVKTASSPLIFVSANGCLSTTVLDGDGNNVDVLHFGATCFRLTVPMKGKRFMTISQTPYQRALSPEPLRAGDKAFFSSQHQYALHQLLLETFLECDAKSDMKRADLARKSGFDPATISRLLADPSNYEASTAAILMAWMGHTITLGKEKISSEGVRRNDIPPLQSRIAQLRGATAQDYAIEVTTTTTAMVTAQVTVAHELIVTAAKVTQK